MEKTEFIHEFPAMDLYSITKDTPTIFIPLECSDGQILNASDFIDFPLDVVENPPSTISDIVISNELPEEYPKDKTIHAQNPNSISFKKYKKPSIKPLKSENSNCSTTSYVCELCDEKFHLSSLLRLHKRTLHAPIKPFQCKKCPQQFNIEKNYILHMATHSSTPAICHECGRKFKRSAGYRGHLITHMVNDNFRCKKCDQDFEYEELYKRHINTNHQLEKSGEHAAVKKRVRGDLEENDSYRKYRCNTCGKKFSTPSNLFRHQMIHSNSKPFQCSICQMCFSQKSSLDRHGAIHSGMPSYKCPKCSMNFSQRGNLRTHIERVHPENSDVSKKFPCPDCSCIFSKLNSLNRHSAKIHSTRQPVSEDGDGNNSIDNVISQLRNLQNNFYPLPDNNLSNNTSLFCNDNAALPITSSTTLENYHLESNVENRLENLNCEQNSKATLIQVQKDDTKLYTCTICSKKFQRPYDLLRHNQIHTNEKPHECGICGQCFAIKNTLQVHLRTHGKDGERITNCYQCPNCFQLFNSLRRLDIHAKSHKGDKLFSCSVCSKSFSSTNNLRIHQYTHRPKNNSQIELRKTMKSPIATEIDKASQCSNYVQTFRRYQCCICGLKFKRLTHLTQHESTHSGIMPFQCLTCKKSFAARSSLNNHRKMHSGNLIKTKECNECDAKFKLSSELKRHKVVHSTKRSILCPYCGKSFKTKGTCRTHIFTHAKDLAEEKKLSSTLNQPEPMNPAQREYVPLMNNNLDTNFETISNPNESENVIYLHIEESLRRDEQIINPLQKQQQQNLFESSNFTELNEFLYAKPKQSAKEFATESLSPPLSDSPSSPMPSSQTLSMKSQQPKNQTCEICSKSFRKPIDLRRHLRTHTKEKPFECEICHNSFSLKCTLETHKLTHSENRSTFECQVCGKHYASQSVLKIHLRIHTNERPYKCTYCSKVFRTSGHQITHMRSHLKLKNTSQKKYRKQPNKV